MERAGVLNVLYTQCIFSSYFCISELSATLLDNTVPCVSVGVMSVLYNGIDNLPETIEDVENLNGCVSLS
jgi:hypothetical protein